MDEFPRMPPNGLAMLAMLTSSRGVYFTGLLQSHDAPFSDRRVLLLLLLLYVDRACIAVAKGDVARDLGLSDPQMGWRLAGDRPGSIFLDSLERSAAAVEVG